MERAGVRERELVEAMRGLRVERRPVAARELAARLGCAEAEVRAALEAAVMAGRVTRLGRSPAGVQLYTLLHARPARESVDRVPPIPVD